MKNSHAAQSKLTRGTAPIQFKNIRISKWNRSSGLEFTAKSNAGLQSSLRESGLLHPLILIEVTEDGNIHFEVIAGANRLMALMQLRGENGELRPEEYLMVPPETSDEELLKLSLDENTERSQLSPAREAFYAARLLKETGITQLKLAALMGKTRRVLLPIVLLP